MGIAHLGPKTAMSWRLLADDGIQKQAGEFWRRGFVIAAS